MRPAESSSDGFETSGNGHATLPLTEASGSDHQVDATVQDESSHVPDSLGPASSPEDAPVTIGRYKVVSLLGSGGFGAVYLARDEKLTRDVSIKVPHRHRVRTPEHLQRYMREARLVAGLDHAKIVPVFDVGETENGMCYVVSKYIQSETLADRVKQDTSPNEALDIVIDLAETLQFVHEQGIVHRDVKPSNVLVDRDGTLFLNDFGLAMSEVTVSERGALIGTPSYMSPEQAFGEGHLVDGRSDVFSLGVMLYEMLSGRRPFRGGTTEQILYQIRNLEPKPLRQRKRDLPVALERVCQKALSKKPGGRYASAIDLAEDLAQVRERFGPSNWSGPANSSIDLAASSTSSRVRLVDHGSAGGSSGLSGNASNSDDASVIVIPKGLRSYDQSDARFFKAMLPGPYDMDGCPESILFWKHRIDVNQTAVDPFRVGVIYGTSGCGKSSFVRAGLIPILENSVRVCLIDATHQGTTQRLTQSLSRLVPTFDAPATSDMPLPDRFASIRRGENLPSGQKVLIVIDQFEQWLNGADDDQRAELTLALRQCDGHRLQTILLVRDDFWLATSRLMRDLDIELSASHNLAMIDLLDQPHAARLLRMLGRAYGRIGSEDVRLKREQRHFIRDAVTALSSGGRVIAVQLALFAEMMKSRPWTRASLRSLHGVDRIVEQFLHESFDAPTAPKEQRIHQAAAHRLLAAMLPETGLIRGGSISRADLMKASGYDESPELMSDLTQILDTRLKLITEVESGEGAVDRKATRYQLTHDTLIPALRRWLMRHENGSMRGRARGQLRHRANAYAERDDRRQLPSMFQWAQFGLLVRRRDWTPAERRMMHAAGREHGVLIALLLFVAGALWFGYRESRSRAVASSLVSQLMVATPTQLPETLRQIDEESAVTQSQLTTKMFDVEEPSRERFLAALALAPSTMEVGQDDDRSGEIWSSIADYALEAPLDLLAIVQTRRPHWCDQLAGRFRTALSDPESNMARRLRAGLLIGTSKASDSLTVGQLDVLAQAIVDESLSNKLEYRALVQLSRALRQPLTIPLTNIHWDSPRLAARDAAATLIRDVHLEHPVDLVDASLGLREDAFELLLDSLAGPSSSSLALPVLGRTDIREPGRRVGRLAALRALGISSLQTHATRQDGVLDAAGATGPPAGWPSDFEPLLWSGRGDVAPMTLIENLLRFGTPPTWWLDSGFDDSGDLRCMQLIGMGRSLDRSGSADVGFIDECRRIARKRFQSSRDAGEHSAARWLLVRLGDQHWIDQWYQNNAIDSPSADRRRTEDRSGASWRVNQVQMPMVRFDADTVRSRSPIDESVPDPNWNEPLPYAFELAAQEVTVEQYLSFDPNYSHRGELASMDPRIPAGVITWEEAVAYCQWLTLRDGMREEDLAYEVDADGQSRLKSGFDQIGGYRLPTIREWTAAWDADPAYQACFMNDSFVSQFARINPHADDQPEPVGGVLPSRVGLFHMAGNAEEWCSERLQSHRALRGIPYSWDLSERIMVSAPHWFPGDINYIRIGFRVARSVPAIQR